MLSLERYRGEEIIIGDPENPLGTVHVVAIEDNKVRLAFDFPRHIQVNRKEIAESKVRRANRSREGRNRP